mmetsp:Transcript_80606/g.236882  ORF Transcript_80606/g.236882 Transcript_80606/m.236882 type:complete len:237 (+) Transcript_80606:883-1593(+)
MVLLLQAHDLVGVLLAQLELLLLGLLVDLVDDLPLLRLRSRVYVLRLLLLLHPEHVLAVLGLLLQALVVGRLLRLDGAGVRHARGEALGLHWWLHGWLRPYSVARSNARQRCRRRHEGAPPALDVARRRRRVAARGRGRHLRSVACRHLLRVGYLLPAGRGGRRGRVGDLPSHLLRVGPPHLLRVDGAAPRRRGRGVGAGLPGVDLLRWSSVGSAGVRAGRQRIRRRALRDDPWRR